MHKKYLQDYYYFEQNHWWFKARLGILDSIIFKILSKKENLNILNIGSGYGIISTYLEKYGKVTSVDNDEFFKEYHNSQNNLSFVFASFSNLPFQEKTFDFVCAFDVLEHIYSEKDALLELKRVLKDDGHYLLTVPSYQFLWSNHDVINYHYRRYTSNRIIKILKQENLNISFCSYFNCFLFLPIALYRILNKKLGFICKYWNKKIEYNSDFFALNNKVLSSLFFRLFKLEKFFLSKNIRFFFGLSIIVYGKKNK